MPVLHIFSQSQKARPRCGGGPDAFDSLVKFYGAPVERGIKPGIPFTVKNGRNQTGGEGGEEEHRYRESGVDTYPYSYGV